MPLFEGTLRGALVVATFIFAGLLAIYPINGGKIGESTDLIGFSVWIGLNVLVVMVVLRACRKIDA
jgi:hypothetical protein